MSVRELIKAKIQERGLSMADLSKGAGKNHAYLQQYIERNVPRRLPEEVRAYLAPRLGVDESQLRDGRFLNLESKLTPPPPKEGASVPKNHVTNVYSEGLLKVLGLAECGADGWAVWNGEIVDWVPRPPNLAGAKDAYAVFIIGDSMFPRYHPGEVAHINPARPVTPGAYVLIQKRPRGPGEAPLAVIKRLVKRSGDRVILEQHNPPKTITLLAGDIVSMHRVVGSAEA